ncbi:DMT family transporter [Sphingomonas sp. ac-8]|uniref:DMT family transporter n=1 Tax=Sphingomonas sp. ac-8 TaxID=3242977 RepID=UPI003A7FF5D9
MTAVTCGSVVPVAPPQQRGLWQRPYLLLTAAALLWASNFLLGRALPAGIAPISLCFWRWVLALPFVLPMAAPHLRRDWPAIRRSLPLLAALAAAGLAGSNTLAYMALRATTATSALLVQSALPMAILLFGLLLFGERPRLRQVGAMLLATAGVLCVILAKPGAGGALNGGTLLAGAAMLAQALYAALLRERPTLHPTSFLFATFALAALLLLPFQIAPGTPLPVADARGMAALLYLAVGPSILAFFLFNRGVELVGSARAAVFFYLMPVFGTLLAVPLLHERIGATELGGFALVGLGFLITRNT